MPLKFKKQNLRPDWHHLLYDNASNIIEFEMYYNALFYELSPNFYLSSIKYDIIFYFLFLFIYIHHILLYTNFPAMHFKYISVEFMSTYVSTYFVHKIIIKWFASYKFVKNTYTVHPAHVSTYFVYKIIIKWFASSKFVKNTYTVHPAP